MLHSTQNTQQKTEVDNRSAHSTNVTSMSTAASIHDVTAVISKKNMDGYTPHMLAAGGLSASIASQLISTITTTSPIAGGIGHTFLLVTCVTGLSTITMHASPLRDVRAIFNSRGSSVAAASVLAYLSLWFATIGIVVLAWAIQPAPVAIIVTITFVLVVLGMIAHAVFVSVRIPVGDHNV